MKEAEAAYLILFTINVMDFDRDFTRMVRGKRCIKWTSSYPRIARTRQAGFSARWKALGRVPTTAMPRDRLLQPWHWAVGTRSATRSPDPGQDCDKLSGRWSPRTFFNPHPPCQHIECHSPCLPVAISFPVYYPRSAIVDTLMDSAISTQRLKLTLVTKAERGSPELEWLHELRSDEKATWWR